MWGKGSWVVALISNVVSSLVLAPMSPYGLSSVAHWRANQITRQSLTG